MIAVRFFAELRRIAGVSEAAVDAATVRDALDQLAEQLGGEIRTKLLPDGELTRELAILLNGRNIRFLEGLDTPLNRGDRLPIVPMVGGGSA